MWESGIGRRYKTRTASSRRASRKTTSSGTASWGGHHLEDARRIWGVGADPLQLQAVGVGDERRTEAQGLANEPGRGARTGPGRLLDLDPDDEPPFAPEWAGFDSTAVGLAPIAPVQPPRDPVTHVCLEGNAQVDGGVDRDGPCGGNGACAKDAGQLPGAVERGRPEPLEQQGQDQSAVEHPTNLIRPGHGGCERPDGSECAGHLTVDVVEGVGEPGA